MNPTATGHLTAPQVAALLGLSTARIHQLTRQGRLATLPGLSRDRSRLYLAADIDTFALIPRPTGTYLGPAGNRAGGAPKLNFNRWTHGLKSRQPALRAFRRTLPLRERRLFDDAVSAAIHQAAAAHSLPRKRHRARVAAVLLVIGVTYGARLAPAFDEDERYRNLVTALRPWRQADTPSF